MNAIQLWRPALDTVYHMDALTLLRQMPEASVDAIITDPPYGLGQSEMSQKLDTGGLFNRVSETWDSEAPTEWLEHCQRILTPGGSVVCFGGRQSIYTFAAEGLRLGWRIVNDITWFKPDAMPNITGRMMTESTERALWFCPDGKGWRYNLLEAKVMNSGQNLRDVWAYGQTRGKRLHPTQKPLRLMERIIRLLTIQSDTVLDPFAGSGTTLVAARNLGRHYIGCDISPEYVDMARQRLALPYMQNMFERLEATP